MSKLFSLSFLQILAACTVVLAQPLPQLSLEESYTLARQYYPLTRQQELIAKTASYSIENAANAYLPQINVNGQATYQSAVTGIPVKLPGFSIPSPDKDQYRVFAELNQVLYDGGMIEQQKQLQKVNEVIEQQKLETELYKLKERINQLFFGILVLDEQLKQNVLLNQDLELGLKKVEAAVKNGIALKSNADLLNADLLKNKQKRIELQTSRRSFAAMLGLFLRKEISDQTVLLKPPAPQKMNEILRPELFVFEKQSKNIDVQNRLLTAKARPKFGLFLQAGAGRPGLNMLSNSFETFYVGGIRLTWNPSIFYTLKNDRSLLELSRQGLDVQRETFLFNTSLSLKQQDTEIGKYIELLDTDDEIITIRKKIKNTAMAQLENGVINASDYLREANAEDQARLGKILHEIQLLMAQYNQQTTTGN